MHSRVRVEAHAGIGGRTVLRRMQSEGGLAVRRTGADVVHLVGTAATPIGDDTIDIEVSVGRGAQLTVKGVAATIALPGPDGGTSSIRTFVTSQDESVLTLTLPPLIVTAAARVQCLVQIALDDGASIDLREEVGLGRFGERPGTWMGRTVIDIDGEPTLRQTQTSESLLRAVRCVAEGDRAAIITRFVRRPVTPEPTAPAAEAAYATWPARGGVLYTSFGSDILAAEHAMREVSPA